MHLKPKRVAITGGYHGVHMSLDVYKRSSRDKIEVIGIDDEFREGDICWLETPLNPTGEAKYVVRNPLRVMCAERSFQEYTALR